MNDWVDLYLFVSTLFSVEDYASLYIQKIVKLH